jgi:hypothetical protein
LSSFFPQCWALRRASEQGQIIGIKNVPKIAPQASKGKLLDRGKAQEIAL